MSPTDATPRPSQVTVAGWAVAVASVVLVVVVFDAMGNLHSVDTHDRIAKSLSSGYGKGLGISVDDAISAMRWGLLVSGAAAAAACILGIYVLQRNKGARIALSIVAGLLLLTSPFTGMFLGVFIAVATTSLWSEPARDWFAGRVPTPRPPRRETTQQPTSYVPPVQQPPAPWVPPTGPVDPGASGPAPTPGWGQPTPYAQPQQQGQPWPAPPQQPYAQPWQQQPYAPPVRDRGPRPRQVRIACLLTGAFSAVTALGLVALLVVIGNDRHRLLEAVKKNPAYDSSISDNTYVLSFVVMGVLFLLWCIGAMVLASLAWRGLTWAWIVLIVSTGLAAILCVLAVPYSLVYLAVLGATLGQLLSRRSRDWFAGR